MDAPSSNKVKIWQNLLVLHFDPARPPGACDESEERPLDELTVQVVTVHMTTKTLNIALCKQDGIADRQTSSSSSS